MISGAYSTSKICLMDGDIRLACWSDQKLVVACEKKGVYSCGGVFSILHDNAIKREGSESRHNETIHMRD